jgi:hypothetical protein
MAKPSPYSWFFPWILNSTSISQFVAVRGTLEKSHPVCDGWSEVRRMYL